MRASFPIVNQKREVEKIKDKSRFETFLDTMEHFELDPNDPSLDLDSLTNLRDNDERTEVRNALEAHWARNKGYATNIKSSPLGREPLNDQHFNPLTHFNEYKNYFKNSGYIALSKGRYENYLLHEQFRGFNVKRLRKWYDQILRSSPRS